MYGISFALIGWNFAAEEGVITSKKKPDLFVHRVPDNSGIWKDEINKIYFGNRRLSNLYLYFMGK